MMMSPWIAALVAVFAWWFFTGIILLVVRWAESAQVISHKKLVVLSVPFFALGLAGLVISSGALTQVNVYVAFMSVLLIWGWIEMAFLLGVITGPERRPCPTDMTGWARFMRAWHTVSHHEFLLLCGMLIVTVVTIGSENIFGFWSYLVLFSARISAKLNLFFGVPRINTEFVPKQLEHLKSYFRCGAISAAFPIGIVFLTLFTAYFATQLNGAQTQPALLGYTLLTALTGLAALEHWLMVIPLPDAKLWRWMLPTIPSTSKTGQSHEL